MGTPAYMAPEQAEGGVIDHRADLFSLGAVLYRMVTGGPAFRGENPVAVLRSLANDVPPPPHEVAPEVPQAFGKPNIRKCAASIVASIANTDSHKDLSVPDRQPHKMFVRYGCQNQLATSRCNWPLRFVR